MTKVVIQPKNNQTGLSIQKPKVAVSIAGPPGPAGTGGFLFTQASPLQVWVVNHNLGFRPTVQVYDTGGSVVSTEVVHVSINQCQIINAVPFAGFCRCN